MSSKTERNLLLSELKVDFSKNKPVKKKKKNQNELCMLASLVTVVMGTSVINSKCSLKKNRATYGRK